ncbi:acid stress response protein YqgB, partial [Klebsiella pneumoniae]
GKSFLVVSPDCHTLFGYVFYDDMNKKPVAQSQNQQIVLGFRTVHGLLSHLWTAIVVNCLTLIIKN